VLSQTESPGILHLGAPSPMGEGGASGGVAWATGSVGGLGLLLRDHYKS